MVQTAVNVFKLCCQAKSLRSWMISASENGCKPGCGNSRASKTRSRRRRVPGRRIWRQVRGIRRDREAARRPRNEVALSQFRPRSRNSFQSLSIYHRSILLLCLCDAVSSKCRLTNACPKISARTRPGYLPRSVQSRLRGARRRIRSREAGAHDCLGRRQKVLRQGRRRLGSHSIKVTDTFLQRPSSRVARSSPSSVSGYMRPAMS